MQSSCCARPCSSTIACSPTKPLHPVRRSRLTTLFWRVHRWLYLASGGRLGVGILGQSALLLTTVGHKSGEPRRVALFYFPHGESYVVVASNAGAPHHPHWYHNLMATPEAEVRIGRRRLAVRAREAEGEERERHWAQVVAADPTYAEYQKRTERRIPLVVLEPEPSHES